MRRSVAPVATLVALLAAGCPPDLGYFRVIGDEPVPPVPPGTDGGVAPPPPGTPAPAPIGTPCTPAHVLLAASRNDSTGTGRVMRLNLPDLTPCRETVVAQEHGAFGSEVLAVAGLPGGGEVVGVSSAVIGLDAEGFPRWRFQPDANLGFYPSRIVEIATESGWNLLVLGTYMGDADVLHVITPDGFLRTTIDVDWSDDVDHVATHPDGFAFLGAGDYGAVESHAIGDTTTELDRGTEVLQVPRAPEGAESFGNLERLDVDRVGRRVVYTWNHWVGQGPIDDPSAQLTVFACGAPCRSFVDATWDPSDPGALLALCDHTEGNAVHVVRVPSDGVSPCTLAVDGTLLSPYRFTDIAVVQP